MKSPDEPTEEEKAETLESLNKEHEQHYGVPYDKGHCDNG